MKKILMIILILFFTLMKVDAQNRWEKLNGPVGGFITALKSKGDTIVVGAGANYGEIYYSTNRGMSWKQANLKLQSRITDFVFTKSKILASLGKQGISASNDLEYWTTFLNKGFFTCLEVDSNNSLYVGKSSGQILYTTDDGLSWKSSLYSHDGEIYKILQFRNDQLLAAVNHNIYIKNIKLNTPWESIGIDSLRGYNGLSSDGDSSIYFFSFPSLFKSTDEGKNWTYNTNKNFWWGNYVYDCIYNKNVIISCNDETGWFGNGWGIAVSGDEGKTWKWSNKGLPPKFSAAYKLAKSGNNTYLGTNAAGVFKSTDFGDSWFPVNNGITAANTLDICFDKKGTYIHSQLE